MKELIEAYLKGTEYYLSECEILIVETNGVRNDDIVYLVTVRNESCLNGVDYLHVGNAELLAFMWSKIK